jgi:hypothetical protein
MPSLLLGESLLDVLSNSPPYFYAYVDLIHHYSMMWWAAYMVCLADKNSFLAMNAEQYKNFGMSYYMLENCPKVNLYLHNHSFGYSD